MFRQELRWWNQKSEKALNTALLYNLATILLWTSSLVRDGRGHMGFDFLIMPGQIAGDWLEP